MAIAARPKPNASHRKRSGSHHRHSKPYLQTYWPYLPMFSVVGAGALANELWPIVSVSADSKLGGAALQHAGTVSRVQVLTQSTATWLTPALLVITFAALGWLVYRHSRYWHGVLVRGERFVMQHQLFDVIITVVAVAGFVLTRTGGLLRLT